MLFEHLLVHLGKGSFDCMAAALRAPSIPLRMTVSGLAET
jgi:hypothetical protein